MKTFLVVIGILCLTFIGPSHTSKADTQLADLGWMAGQWIGVQDGVETDEAWLEPRGNSMLGIHRDTKDGKTASFEFLRIASTAEGITFWASPQGKPATPFRLKEMKGKRVVFENPEHDFPQRIIYWLDGDDSLHARIEGTYKGQPASEEWTWKRSKNK